MPEPELFIAQGSEHVDWRGGEQVNFEDIAWAGAGGFIRVYDARLLFRDGFGSASTLKRGFVAHHDAAAMADVDKDFNGTTLDESFERLEVIERTHVDDNGWGGIGYHELIDPFGRVFIVGSPWQRRAHAAAYDYEAGATVNDAWYGVCFMGDHSSSRPTELAMRAFRGRLQILTDRFGREMRLGPHKRFTAGTECPGGWAALDAWRELVLRPGAVQPPAPAPAPAPPAPAPVFDKGAVLAHVRAMRQWHVAEGNALDIVEALLT